MEKKLSHLTKRKHVARSPLVSLGRMMIRTALILVTFAGWWLATRAAENSYSIQVLHEFDSARPVGGLTLGKDGAFYGLPGGGGTNRAGTIFRFTADAEF